jgi:hypothetical protein
MAGKANLYLSKAVKFVDRISGHSAREWKMKSNILSEASKKHITPKRAERKAHVETGRSFQTRAKTGVVAGAVGAGGFLGLHKYHQHKDNQILKKIDSMYRGSDESEYN